MASNLPLPVCGVNYLLLLKEEKSVSDPTGVGTHAMWYAVVVDSGAASFSARPYKAIWRSIDKFPTLVLGCAVEGYLHGAQGAVCVEIDAATPLRLDPPDLDLADLATHLIMEKCLKLVQFVAADELHELVWGQLKLAVLLAGDALRI